MTKTPAACESAEVEVRKCECGEEETSEGDPATGHTFTSITAESKLEKPMAGMTVTASDINVTAACACGENVTITDGISIENETLALGKNTIEVTYGELSTTLNIDAEKLDMVPRFLLEVSPFHGSVYFTSMGSLGIKPIYHHLYDFGTVPVFCAFGRKRRAEKIKDGEIVERKYVDLKFNLDERICDGFCYAGVIKFFLRLLSHPEVLDYPPDTVESDNP